MGQSFEDDPLTAALQPPPDETPEERAQRERAEADARRVSEAIDEQIKTEKAALKKKKRPVKVLLLGQSESGKSTTLKNFQLTYARKAWAEERLSWRAVVQLNLVRNITTILGALSSALASAPEDDDGLAPLAFGEKHKLLARRLAPLRELQAELEGRLGASSTEPAFVGAAPASALPAAGRGDDAGAEPFTQRQYEAHLPASDLLVRSANGWKGAIDRLLPKNKRAGATSPEVLERDEVSDVLAGCRDDIIELWADPLVRELLRRRGIRPEDAPGFFLDDAARIASRGYEPTDGDVVRARLRTIGVQEHRFIFEGGRASGNEWILYDVGGDRRARARWAPYFDDVDAIIFLAPVSVFDEKLAEDPRVNRLEDTYLLWKALSRNKLLAGVQVVLFLNKIDLLERKLRAGVKIKDHVPSFGDRPNDVETAVKYFQTHFREIARQYNPQPRQFYVHLTSVVDTKATAATLAIVEEGILHDHLRRADLV